MNHHGFDPDCMTQNDPTEEVHVPQVGGTCNARTGLRNNADVYCGTGPVSFNVYRDLRQHPTFGQLGLLV